MLPVLAQLQCAIDQVELPAEERALGPPAVGVEHVLRFQNALTGEALTPGEVGGLVPSLLGADYAPIAAAGELQTDPGRTRYRRAWALPPRGTYRVRVEGSGRYTGCERTFPAEGAPRRALVVSLVPRARDVVVRAVVSRGDGEATFPDGGYAGLELRPDAQAERDVVVHRGTCAGEGRASGRDWCVRFLAGEPGPTAFVVRAPGFGLARVTLDPNGAERTLLAEPRWEGHIHPNALLRVSAGFGVVNAEGLNLLAAIDAVAPSSVTGRTCPLANTCLRPVVHVGVGLTPYRRETELLGPGPTPTLDSTTSGVLGGFEVGAGLLVLPPGTGDRFRASVTVSGLLASRGDERDAARMNVLLSPATTVLGGVGEVLLGVRLFGGIALQTAARVLFVPVVGSRGRQFSYLGDASVSTQTSSLVHLSLQFGLGVEL
ncbi:MAG: hypothetical protein HY909_10055 [Deltaproteobacteria bacterium]|nr:hypothetical protein [Deltaproteobacteria bacterium]